MSVRYPYLYYSDWSSFERRREYIRQRLLDLDSYTLEKRYELYSRPLLRELDEIYASRSYYHLYYRMPYYYRGYSYELDRVLETNRSLEREIQLLKSRTDESLMTKNRELEEQLLRKSRELDEAVLSKDSTHELKQLKLAYDESKAKYDKDLIELHEKYNKLNSTHLELMDTHKKEKSDLQDEVQFLREEVDNQIQSNEFLKKDELKKIPTKKRRTSVRGRTPTSTRKSICKTRAYVQKHEWVKY